MLLPYLSGCLSSVSGWLCAALNRRVELKLSQGMDSLESSARAYVFGSDIPVVGKVLVPDTSLEPCVRGDHIRAEFQDTQLDLEDAIRKCTEKAKAKIRKRPIFTMSLVQHGRSSLVNHLLDLFPGSKEKPEVGSRGPVTRAIKGFVAHVETGWASKGLEDVIFFDSPGWQLGRSDTSPLEAQKAEAERMVVPPEALQDGLVLLLVHKVEDVVTDLANPSFADFLAAIFRSTDQRWILLPVLSKAEAARCSAEDLSFAKARWQEELEALNVKHGNPFNICPVMSWSHSCSASAQNLYAELAKACSSQLTTESALGRVVLQSIESELLEILKHWGKKGDSPNSLARRFAWLCARQRQLRLKDLQLSEAKPWEDAVKVIENLKQRLPQLRPEHATDDWHDDELRRDARRRRAAPVTSKPPSRPVRR